MSTAYYQALKNFRAEKENSNRSYSEVRSAFGSIWNRTGKSNKSAKKAKSNKKATHKHQNAGGVSTPAKTLKTEARDKVKYKNVEEIDFCGTAAGRKGNPHSFPIDTLERYAAAERYRRNALDQPHLLACMKKVAARKAKDMSLSKREREKWAAHAAPGKKVTFA